MIDLRSDTVTRPTPDMLAAMMSADIGDDVFGDDPSCNRLEAHAAELAGMEAGLFVPSGTMGNQIAIRCWTQPGDEVLMEAGSHPFNYEAAGAAVISGVQIKTLTGENGQLAPQTIWEAVRVDDVHFAPATLVSIENTANRGGGTIYDQDALDAIGAGCTERGLRAHMDGARVFNAVVGSGVALSRVVQEFDSITFCLSKGLGAPVGSVLCGPADMIHRGRRFRKFLGGGMRQAGFLAAAGIYALEHHVERLADDHARCRTLWSGLTELGYAVREPETNMVYVTVPEAHAAVAFLAERGVQTHAVAADCIRLVTHLDVDDDGIEQTLAGFAAVRA
ncbi:MAG: low-specificity L-threonine aldolase [Proteobacteria bacterium]|nr:low-specificity L-threonine aldolase [Pseudomonadota bacterium]MCP4920601.1 low-specificity L-threonine aldolase [Pseudomonadota bacterium]